MAKTKTSILDFFQGSPRQGQRDVLLRLEAQWKEADVFVISAPTACHARGSYVLNSDGLPICVDDVKVGTELMGPDGTPRTVQEVYSGVTELVRITPKRGKPWVVTKDHTLLLHRYTNDKQCGMYQVSVKDWQQWPESAKKNSFQMSTGYVGKQQELPMDPYTFGLWLGDGHSADASLTTMDQECAATWSSLATSLGARITKHDLPNNRASTYRITGRPNKAVALLRSMNVLKNKHIPDEFLMASQKQRAELLAGLIDSDGNKSHTGWEWSQKNKKLLLQVKHLVKSLGMQCKESYRIVKGQEYGRLNISVGPASFPIPTRLARKTTNVNKYQNPLRSRFTVEDIGPGEFVGFLVDKDHLYLTDDFVITHNCGKTKMMTAIAKWVSGVHKGKSHIMLPNNILVNQVEKSERLFSLKARSNYTCYLPQEVADAKGYAPEEVGGTTSCETHYSACGNHCAACPYVAAVRKSHAMPYTVSNYHTTMAHKLAKSVMIVDEAHLLVPMIRELEAKHVWLPEEHGRSLLPHYINTYGKLLDYLDGHPELKGKVWDEIRQELGGGRERFLIERKPRLLRGVLKDCLTLLPIDTSKSNKSQVLMSGKKVEKIVLLSGTISKLDVGQLGLQGKRVLYLDCASPIPVAQRPIVFDTVARVSASQYGSLVPKLAAKIAEYAAKHPGKALIHAPYSLAAQLGPALVALLGERVLLHTSSSKQDVVAKFTTQKGNWFLIGSGLEEGLDLYGDDYTLQFITKVPFQNLGDSAWKYVAENYPDRYAWEAIKKVVQATGRIARGPEDSGTTIVLDANLQRLLETNEELFPTYFTEAICHSNSTNS